MKPRRIFYVTNARLPTEKAHGLATIKLAEAFAKQGLEVTVFRPWRVNPLRDDLYRYYGVEQNFRVATLPSLDFLWLGFGGRFFLVVQLLSFSVVTTIYLCLRYGLWGALRDTVIFSEDHVPLFFASLFTSNIFVDIHDYPTNNAWYGRVLRRAIGCSVQTRWKVDQLGRDFGIGREKIAYWPNGTETERFDTPVSRGEAQRALRLPLNRRLVLYVGSLPRWKGVETLVQAAAALPEDVTLYIVGGGNAEVERLRLKNQASGIGNVVLVGQRPWREIPLWLKAARVLVLPNTGREEISRHYTSPLKLFEYMASGTPIVASDIPSIREIMNDTMGFFAVADDAESFARAIERALGDPEEAARRAEQARADVRKYTWARRAEEILARMQIGSNATMVKREIVHGEPGSPGY
jgi:glycosyltransferase involved in cell wall biosynthesis